MKYLIKAKEVFDRINVKVSDVANQPTIDYLSTLLEEKRFILLKFHQSVLSGENFYSNAITMLKSFLPTLNALEVWYICLVKNAESDEKKDLQNITIIAELSNLLNCYIKLCEDIARKEKKDGHVGNEFYFKPDIVRSVDLQEIEGTLLQLYGALEQLKEETAFAVEPTDTESKESENKKRAQEASNKQSAIEFHFFKVNVALSELDNSFRCGETYLRALLKIRHFFSTLPPGSKFTIAQILSAKCDFLIKKVFIRYKLSTIYDDSEVLGELDATNLNSCPYYKHFHDQTEDRYDNKNAYNANSAKYIEISARLKSIDKITYADIHFLTKYYHKNSLIDVESYEHNESLTNLVNKLQPKQTEGVFLTFDEKAHKSLHLLLKKNSLKIRISQLKVILNAPTLTTDAVKASYIRLNSAYKDVTAISKKHNIHDYYEHKLFCDITLELLKYFSNKHRDEIISQAEFLLEMFQELDISFSEFEKNLFWVSSRSSYLPLFLPFAECIHKHKEDPNEVGKVNTKKATQENNISVGPDEDEMQAEEFNAMDTENTKKAIQENNIPAVLNEDETEMEWDLFLDSSYLLPINIEDDEREYRQIKNEVRLCRAKISNIINFNASTFVRSEFTQKKEELIIAYKNESESLKIKLDNIKDDLKGKLDSEREDLKAKLESERDKMNKDLDDRMKQNQMTAIQLIGLFVGFIIFTLGSVSIIPKFERSYSAIFLFLFVFASGIGLFIALLKIIFKSPDNTMISLQDLYRRNSNGVQISPYLLFIGSYALVFSVAIGGIIYFRHAQIPTINYNQKIETESKRYQIHTNKDSIYKIDSTVSQSTMETHKDSINR